jgi:hypothetical protein
MAERTLHKYLLYYLDIHGKLPGISGRDQIPHGSTKWVAFE